MKKTEKLMILTGLILALLLSACGQSASAAAAEGKNTVRVSNVDEFLKAIAPDTQIIMQQGLYELDRASDYGKDGSTCYRWEEVYDGYELVLSDVENLSISAAKDADVTISVTPRYANVLHFDSCDGLVLNDLTCGHTREPGACSGGVIRIENTDKATISDCDLYGCGIIGVDAFKCSELTVTDCDIYECSLNAVTVNSCRDVRLLDCDIYKCGSSWGGLFDVSGTTGFALVDCEIENNTAAYLLHTSYSPETYLLGCETKNNTFTSSVFCISGKAPVVEGTSLHENAFTAWYDSSSSTTPGAKCLDRAGHELSKDQLENMKQTDCTYDGPVIAENPASPEIKVDASGRKVAMVRTADEFLAAIQPGVNVFLDADTIDLSTASDYGSGMSDYYYWRECYDGAELVITGADGLSITSEIRTLIDAVPRYANVLNFENCHDLWLSGFTAGHTTEPGECCGGVLNFKDCTGVGVDGCSLYGCGTLGISAENTDGLNVTGTEIHDCSFGAVSLYATHDVVFKNCNIHDCPQPELCFYDGGATYDNGRGRSAYYESGCYTLDKDGMPVPYGFEENTEPMEEVKIYVTDAADLRDIDSLKLGKNDVPVKLYSLIYIPQEMGIDMGKARWIVEEKLSFTDNGDGSITLTSNLEAGESSALYVEYYDMDGSRLGALSIPVTG